MKMEKSKCTNPCGTTVLIALIAIAVSSGRSAVELNILGNALASVGGLMMTWSAQQEACQSACSGKQTEDRFKALEDAVKALQKGNVPG